MITGHQIHQYLGLNSKQDSFGVYTGFQEINGHRAETKVGRSKNAQAIQRGRAQGGAARPGAVQVHRRRGTRRPSWRC